MYEAEKRWVFNLRGTTSDRGTPRTSVPRNRASRLVGFDGNETGGLRPFPGFRTARELDFANDVAIGSEHNHTSVVTDLFPFSVRQGSGDYVFGFVYRAVRKTGTANPGADVFVEWYAPGDTSPAWQVESLANMTDVSETEPMDLVSGARTCFVFLRGVAPQALTFTESGGTTSLDARDAGPGTRPAAAFSATNTSPGTGAVALASGNYSFAYELRNSVTGRRSGLSEITVLDTASFPSSPDYVEMSPGSITPTWDRVYVFRSVRTTDAAGTYTGAILHLDSIFKDTDISGGKVWVKLSNNQLAFQSVYLSRQVFDEELPYGSCAGFLNGTLFVSGMRSTPTSKATGASEGDEIRNVGEVRWSSSTEYGPELFSPLDRFVPSNPTSEVIAFGRSGPALVGLTRNNLVYVRRSNAMNKFDEIHEGYGIVGPKAKASMGGMLHWVSPRGLQRLDPDGQLVDVRVIDELVLNEWTGAESWSMASDSELGCMFLLSPDDGKASLFWMKTGTLTELEGLPFTTCASGWWPRDPSDMDSELVQRAMMVMNFPIPAEAPSGWVPKVMFADRDRSRTITGDFGSAGGTMLRLLDPDGDSTFVTDAAFTGAGYTAGDLDVVVTDRTVGTSGVVGCRVYVTDSSDQDYVGQWATIVAATAGTLTLAAADKANLADLPEGSTVVVSPVVQNWVGACLGAEDAGDGDSEATYSRIRHASGHAPHFEGVAGTARASRTWAGQFWAGNDQTPAVTFLAVDTDGTASTVQDGVSTAAAASGGGTSSAGARKGYQGNAIAPGVAMWNADLDYRLLGVRVTGRIETSERR